MRVRLSIVGANIGRELTGSVKQLTEADIPLHPRLSNLQTTAKRSSSECRKF